jgi:hypothetical protein
MAVWVVVGSGAYREDGIDQVFSSKKLADAHANMLRFARGRVSVEKREI